MGLASKIPTFSKQRLILSCLLVVTTLSLYAPVAHHQFLKLWDDDAYITDNPHVRPGLSLTNIKWAFTSFEQSNWHPVAWLSHMLDCQLFGLNPGPQHVVNAMLHAANVLLLFWILQKATGAIGRSFLVSALFAVHPLNVETVAWLAQRKSLLSAFCSLLAVAAYGWFVREHGWKSYAAIMAAFAVALMAKPMAVTLPLLLLLFDYWPLQRLEKLPFARRWARLALEKTPLFLMSIASAFLTEMAQSAGGSVMGLSLLPLHTRIENALITCVAYIGKVVWPARLSTYYPLQFSPAPGDVFASVIILIAVTIVVLHFRHLRYLLAGWLLYLISLVPVIGIVQVGFQGMADRYTYIPAIGLFLMLVWGIGDAVETIPAARLVAVAGAILVLTALSVTTKRYLACWQDNVTLFAHARQSWGRPDMWMEQLYGNALFSAGQIDEALQLYENSCAIQSKTEYCHYNIAHILAARGQFPQALQEYQLALRYTANREIALLCLTESGEVQLRMGQYDAAQKSVTQALAIDPANPAALQLRSQIIPSEGVKH